MTQATALYPGPIAVISPFWLPIWGGAEQYQFRLAKALLQKGFDVRVLCATAEEPGRNNGDMPATRLTPLGNFEPVNWLRVLKTRTLEDFRHFSEHFAFMDAAVRWCRENGIRLVLMGTPIQQTQNFHMRELYVRLKDSGIKVGLFHHDIPHIVSEHLRGLYVQRSTTWEEASEAVLRHLRALASNSTHAMEWAVMTSSPALFDPDFVISNSEWSGRFVHPLGRLPTFVLHPLMDADYATVEPCASSEFKRANVLMLNPQGRKNPELMAKIIRFGNRETSYRLLKGGWGNSFGTFKPMLVGLLAGRKANVDFVEYVDDIKKAYSASDLFVMPSFEEGYGMSAVEAMYCGVPVVCSNYPAIVEAVGDGALTLCPFRNGHDDWISAVERVLSDKNNWRNRAVERVGFLKRRQSSEIDAMSGFLASMM